MWAWSERCAGVKREAGPFVDGNMKNGENEGPFAWLVSGFEHTANTSIVHGCDLHFEKHHGRAILQGC